MKLVGRCLLGGFGVGLLLYGIVLAVIAVKVGLQCDSATFVWLLIYCALYGLFGTAAGGLLGLLLLLIRRLSGRAGPPPDPVPLETDAAVWPPPPDDR